MSHSSVIRRTVALGALAALIPAAAAPAAPTRLASAQAVSPLVAFNGTVAWSSLDPATKQFRLLLSNDGGPAAPAANLAAAATAFDVDLGSSRQGRTQAVFSRDGDLYRYSLSSTIALRLTKLNSAAREFLPTITRGQIAFVRAGTNADDLMIGNTTTGFKKPRLLLRLAHSRGRIVATELSWDRIAYVVQRGESRQWLHVKTLRTLRDRVIMRASSGSLNLSRLTRPSVTPDLKAFVFARTNTGSGVGNQVFRYDIASGRLSAAPGSSRYRSAQFVNPALGVATFSDDSSTGTCFANVTDTPDKTLCHVDVSGPLAFK